MIVSIVGFILLFLILIFSKYATIQKTKKKERDIFTDKLKQDDRHETENN